MRPSTSTIDTNPPSTGPVEILPPQLAHGAGMWRVARDSGALELNTSYAYLLWARDFSATCRVALLDGEVVGFVSGYLRPDAPDRLFVWQVAVDSRLRGQGVAARLIDELASAHPQATALETTITDDNAASNRLFASFAERRGAEHRTERGFDVGDFPDGHEAEVLHVIAPLHPAAT
ncbi:diaminobutyrate acetyltransferase [Georgenia sp. Z1344]|uniref:diaminobutyrate acetyltransferase n=1 Tax=Georgenia sp. Z1344 TaxID=3416706 RepID=UPI003CE8C9EA